MNLATYIDKAASDSSKVSTKQLSLA